MAVGQENAFPWIERDIGLEFDRWEMPKVSPATNKVVVGGLNMIKKATKPNQQTGEGGGLISKEAPIHASNVMLVDAKTQKPTRKRS